MSAAGDAASIERSGNEIVVNSGSVACNVAPTVTNTDRIVVNDTSGQGTRLRIDVGGGPFAPGASDEAGVRHGRRDGRRRHPRARPGDDDISGGAGDDRYVEAGAQGDDEIDGGAGRDLVEHAGSSDASLRVHLRLTRRQDTGGAGTDEVVEFENVIGRPFADTLLGSAGANQFEIRDGAGDEVSCRGGADTVVTDVEGVDAIIADC